MMVKPRVISRRQVQEVNRKRNNVSSHSRKDRQEKHSHHGVQTKLFQD